MSEIGYSADNDYYDVFDIPPTATPEEIGKAHKRLAKQCHPDLHPDKDWATERFKEVNQIYAVLKDPVNKGEYDRLRWAAIGQNASHNQPRGQGPVKRPPQGSGDAERHHKDRMMSYFILGLEVVVMTIIFCLVLYRAISKEKF